MAGITLLMTSFATDENLCVNNSAGNSYTEIPSFSSNSKMVLGELLKRSPMVLGQPPFAPPPPISVPGGTRYHRGGTSKGELVSRMEPFLKPACPSSKGVRGEAFPLTKNRKLENPQEVVGISLVPTLYNTAFKLQ